MNKIIAVDFDGTLCMARWPDVGNPNIKLINDLIQKQRDGDKIILWTCRDGEALENAVKWCGEYNLIFDAINDNVAERIALFGHNSRKISCDVYIDDKSCVPVWD